jgi:transposase-like protein
MIRYAPRMADELDEVLASGDCPGCRRAFSVSYRTLRLGRTYECQGCGQTIQLEDATPIGAVQRLMDEQEGEAEGN